MKLNGEKTALLEVETQSEPSNEPAPHWTQDSKMGMNDPFGEDLFSYSETEKSDRWSVSWADLMMTMFIFFTLLYVYQVKTNEIKVEMGDSGSAISDRGAYQAVNMNSSKGPTAMKRVGGQHAHDEFVDDTGNLKLRADRAVRISLAGDIRFDTGSAKLSSKVKWRLRQIAGFLKDNEYAVNVIGHTDGRDDQSLAYPSNWELSTARACAVTRYLIDQRGVDESRFFVSGHSRQHQLVPGTSSRNRAMNRRVEIVIMKEIPYAPPISSKASLPSENKRGHVSFEWRKENRHTGIGTQISKIERTTVKGENHG